MSTSRVVGEFTGNVLDFMSGKEAGADPLEPPAGPSSDPPRQEVSEDDLNVSQ